MDCEMLRIGVTQRVQDLSDRGERRDCLDQAWTSLLGELGCLPVPLPNRLVDAAAAIDGFELDAVVLSGGNDLSHFANASNTAPERDRFERALLDECARRRFPVFGVCRGMQMLVHYHGGSLEPISGHVAEPHSLTVVDRQSMPLEDRDEVNSFHHWGIAESSQGPDLKVIAVAHDGSVEAVAHRHLPQWAVMWHPERAPNDRRDVQLIGEFLERYAK